MFEEVDADKLSSYREANESGDHHPAQVADPPVGVRVIAACQGPEQNDTSPVEQHEQRQSRNAQFGAKLEPKGVSQLAARISKALDDFTPVASPHSERKLPHRLEARLPHDNPAFGREIALLWADEGAGEAVHDFGARQSGHKPNHGHRTRDREGLDGGRI